MHIVNSKFKSKKLQNEQNQSVNPRLGKMQQGNTRYIFTSKKRDQRNT